MSNGMNVVSTRQQQKWLLIHCYTDFGLIES